MDVLQDIAESLRRIADALAPAPKEKVGTPYVAGLLGLTTTRIAEMARDGTIPKGCIVVGSGSGKGWKFHREQIEKWIKTR